jgi:hypothetical protein
MRKSAALVVAIGSCCTALGARAQEGDAPELDFLEYLGSWQADDDEWLAIAEWEKDNPPPRPAPEQEQEPADDEGERAEREPQGKDDDQGT